MKIVYFTGTGNCLAVAKRFDAELLSVPQLIKNNCYELTDDLIGIIYPDYANSVPNIVENYLKKCKIKADYVFVIATYGCFAGGTLHKMRTILESNGNKADCYNKLLMVDNYLPLFDVKEQIAKLPQKDIETNLNRIVEEVNARTVKKENDSLTDKLLTCILGSFEHKYVKYTSKMFRVTDSCIGCGICAKVCPVKNISQTDKNKPVFAADCESCFACTHNCPQGAIQPKLQRSRERFRNPEITLNEIIEANN
ncbi:MAG: EFR1 family ferrodoxin [Candidatus Gastranaerophilales bacterium]|nr:EFR1 family ferrodoxin [Candidatus Gastranaerophilales bacterium]